MSAERLLDDLYIVGHLICIFQKIFASCLQQVDGVIGDVQSTFQPGDGTDENLAVLQTVVLLAPIKKRKLHLVALNVLSPLTLITIGLSLGITAIGIELLGFFSGISMFRTSISLFSIFLHGFACLATSQWLLQSWHSSSYWLIFMVCSLFPAIIESVTIVCSFIGSSKEF